MHHNSTDSHHPNKNHYNATHSDKHKSHNNNDQVNEISGQTCASKTTKAEPEDIIDPMTLTVQIATLTLHQALNHYHDLTKLLKSS